MMFVHQHGESAQILQPGQVLTVEPGLYIVSDTKLTKTNQILTPLEWHWDSIEDDVLVTTAGHEVLTAGVPKVIRSLNTKKMGISRPIPIN